MNPIISTHSSNRDMTRAVILVDGIRVKINFSNDPTPKTMNTIEKMLLQSAGKHRIRTENQ